MWVICNLHFVNVLPGAHLSSFKQHETAGWEQHSADLARPTQDLAAVTEKRGKSHLTFSLRALITQRLVNDTQPRFPSRDSSFTSQDSPAHVGTSSVACGFGLLTIDVFSHSMMWTHSNRTARRRCKTHDSLLPISWRKINMEKWVVLPW